MSEPLNWDATYAIAKALIYQYPDVKLEDVSLRQVYLWTIGLPDFSDDPLIANEGILEDIYKVWFEETIHDDK
jgi:FeS assembly protein IscX